MEDKKKVLFFMWSYSLGGGAEKILSTIVTNLSKEKYDIDILEIEHFDKGYEPIGENVKILKPYQMYTQPRLLRALLWRIRIFFPRILRKIIVKNKYDIEVSFTTMNPPLLFTTEETTKKIAWIHGSIEGFLKDNKKRLSHKKQLGEADKIVAISKKTRESIELVYPEYRRKIVTIYNGYNFDEIREKSNEEVDIIIEKHSICTIGRIEELKGSSDVVEVLKVLHDGGKKYHLYFIGTGDMEKELRHKVKEYGFQDYVHFLGYQKNPYKYLKHMKVLLSMSKQEGFPGVYVEALSLGVPFVSTDVGGSEELSHNDQFGKIINDIEEAANQVEEYISGNIQINKNGAKEFIENFTIAAQIKEIENIFN